MKRTLLMTLAVAGLLLGAARYVAAHCEVPCGIYDDQRRFEQMLEDQTTIAKACTAIQDLSKTMSQGADPLSMNQAVRWITTKDKHATDTQETIAQYFMTQRIKPGATAEEQRSYFKKLSTAHAVLIAAMKAKQAADPAVAEALREAIYNFYRAYEGKEPHFESQQAAPAATPAPAAPAPKR